MLCIVVFYPNFNNLYLREYNSYKKTPFSPIDFRVYYTELFITIESSFATSFTIIAEVFRKLSASGRRYWIRFISQDHSNVAQVIAELCRLYHNRRMASSVSSFVYVADGYSSSERLHFISCITS